MSSGNEADMAAMIPRTIADTAPHGERVVFEALRDQLADDVIVLHSQRYFFESRDTRPPRQGECDFMILDSNRGILNLEVKGAPSSGSTLTTAVEALRACAGRSRARRLRMATSSPA